MNKTLFIATIFALGLFMTCQRKEQTVTLALKYPDGQVIVWDFDGADHTDEYKNDSLWRTDDVSWSGTTQEEILDKIDSTVFIKHTNTETIRTRDPKTGQYSTRDTVSYMYSLQTSDGRIMSVENGEKPDSSAMESYRNKFKDLAPKYPLRAVPVGYTWTQTSKVELKDGGINDVTTSYKIRSLAKRGAHDCAIIDFTTELTYPIDRFIEEDSATLRGMGTSKTTGIIYHAYDIGVIIEFEQHAEAVANLTEITAEGESPVVVKKKTSRSYKLKDYILPGT